MGPATVLAVRGTTGVLRARAKPARARRTSEALGPTLGLHDGRLQFAFHHGILKVEPAPARISWRPACRWRDPHVMEGQSVVIGQVELCGLGQACLDAGVNCELAGIPRRRV